MNRFRTRKRAKEAVEEGRSWSDPDGSSFPSFSSKSIRRGKQAQAEPKFELDLSTALPSSDKFRTSLLMPNLSARFSMLREQDDPTSKIGKANDDSVLFPKRASRLNFFGHPGLSDIAETAPLDSIRRPFASERADSYQSSEGYGTDDDSSHGGSVMSRPKHREGNNLFGGRQKIYKIPVGGSALAKNLGSASVDTIHGSGRRMGGRALYEDDVTTASFRRLGSEEYGRPTKGEPAREEENGAPTDDRSASPPPAGYNRNRETSSSTASGPSNIRTSTAATSITSQSVVSLPGASGHSTSSPSPSQHSPTIPAGPVGPVGPERATTRARRLYGQGLDQQMHDQQSNALHKLDSLQQRQPPQHLVQSQSAFNLRDHYQRAGSPYALPGNREVSPPSPSVPASPSQPAFGTVENRALSPHGDCFPIPHGPTSTDPDGGSVLSSAVQPNDRGKATALGAFNKPSMPYDELQYSQRQFQLQQAREGSPVERISSPATEDDRHHARPRRDGSDASSQGQSVASTRLRDEFLSSPTNLHVGEKVASSQDIFDVELEPTSNGTFFAQSSESDERSESGSETEEDRPVAGHQLQNPSETEEKSQPHRPRDDANEHSAYSLYPPHPLYKDFTQGDSPGRSSTASRTHARDGSLQGKGWSEITDADSPTLGPAAGLSGLVRAHLRNDSGHSSIYPASSPVLGPRPSPGRSSSEPVANTWVPLDLSGDTRDEAWVAHEHNGDTSDRPDLSLDAREQVWDLDKHVDDSPGKSDPFPAQPEAMVSPPLSLRAKQILDQAAALRDQERLRVQQTVSEGGPAYVEARTRQETEPEDSWQPLHESRHQRTESTETEKERQDFATELSHRRKRVQEKLKGFAEDESGCGSPMPGKGLAGHSPTKYANAFGPLKSKLSKGSLAGRQDPSFKAMKTLGMTGSAGSHPPRRDHSEEEEQRMRLDPGMRPTGRSVPSSSRPDYRNESHPVPIPRQRQASDEGYKGSTRGGPSPPSVRTTQDQSTPAGLEEHSRRGNERHHDNFDIGNAVGARGIPNAPYGQMSRFDDASNPPRRSPDAPDDRDTRTRSPSAVSGNFAPSNNATATDIFGSTSPLSLRFHKQPTTGFDQRPYPGASNASSRRPTLDGNSAAVAVPMSSAISPPKGFPISGRIPNHRKKSVNKSQISDPTFLSGTSSVNTRNLPATEGFGARGEGPSRGFAPPLPPINPRRRTAQQTIANVFGRSETSPTSRTGDPAEQGRGGPFNRNVDPRSHVRHRLRKSSSEGGNLGARVRQQALTSPPPAVPQASQPNRDMF